MITLFFLKLQELGTDVNLYALVFGESVLNDAVCVILFPFTCFLMFSTATHILLGMYLCLTIKVAISLYR
jgi:NhaP-type Na+/H+ or K+/H+ antiporter